MIGRRLLVSLAIVVLLQWSSPASTAHAATRSVSCQSYTVPVALASGQPLQYTIYGELCNPPGGPSHTVQLLIPGATYGHIYWDFPTIDGVAYSYVQAANAAGYSTFNIDRLGTGLSSHPDLSVVTVTMYTHAFIVHEIVQDLRNGLAGNPPFSHVILVGHSLGSITAIVEAGTPSYSDVDAVIITGLTHSLNLANLTLLVATLYPAALDPRFAGSGIGSLYLTTEPGTRGNEFYYLGNTDPNVLAEDEATKETATLGEVQSFLDPLLLGTSMQITVPVLLVAGRQDSLLCGLLATNCNSSATLLAAEAPYYSPQAHLQAVVIPGSGHDLNLNPGHDAQGHPIAPAWYTIGLAWALRNLAP